MSTVTRLVCLRDVAIRISGPSYVPGFGQTLEEVKPEDLTARERHKLQKIAADARVAELKSADTLEEMVERAYAAQQ